MNDLSGSSFFPTETGRIDNAERRSPRARASQDILRNSRAQKFFSTANATNLTDKSHGTHIIAYLTSIRGLT
ncbi:hypothetical protein TNCV_1992931 [Trichonephila clavipes]|nr:hypothetical protein TNCV_1992931 [Trichonephila clavipes]